MNYLIVIFVLCCCLPYKTVQEKIPEKSKDVKRDLDSLFKSKLTGFKLDKNIIAADTGITESPYVKLQRGENTEISKQHNCKQEENCFLPTCFCKTVKYPFMKLTSIPQIVYFAFSGSLKMEHWMILNKLFNGRRRNPDNRMATMSIYVCGQGIDYDVVKYFYDNKHDIGVCGTITDGNYIQIVQKGDIPVNGLVGFKCLTSETLCNGNDDYLHDLGYSYIIRQNAQEKNLLWPYTSIINKKSVGISNMQHNKEFWNIPVNGIFQNNGSICVSNNNCLKTGSDQRVMFDFIWNKFKHTFKTSRSPFGIHLDLNVFLDDIYIKVLDNLISKLLQLKDVFIVDVLKMIKWIRHPKGTNSLSQFKPWDVEHTGLKEETQQKSRLTKKLIHYIRNDTSVAVSAKDAVHSKSGFLQADMPSTQNGHCYQGLNCKLPFMLLSNT
ncbi:hypothetical protein KUTeg_023918 [Tegillarca granosa]|uniref:Uncharacterized protein n=1 Tax=Tegillarca granosa TaxID=220873 RepID=A0ABQ9E1G5_TEGGR|nr:hypothetical protein KUTeg_023918 [Tegillarca granosa]